MLDNDVYLNIPEEAYSQISSATAYINKNLKLLAKIAAIEKTPLSTSGATPWLRGHCRKASA